ncbi:MAG: hypothetical protein L6R48_19385 [Planctomycetes bacterium]|nr:hypothetical protein [Planctomycetota bacterium]
MSLSETEELDPATPPPGHNPAGTPLTEAETAADDRRDRLIGGGISASVHALAILGLTLVVTATREIEKETPPVRVITIHPPPQPPDTQPLERTLETKIGINVDDPEATNATNVTQLDLPAEITQRETEVDSPVPKGRE